MTTDQKIIGTTEAWESRELGANAASARKVSPELHQKIEDALGLQMISIRLSKELIDAFKVMGQFHGIGYQPLMRDALQRFAESEMKAIVSGIVESQKESKASAKNKSDSLKLPNGEKRAA